MYAQMCWAKSVRIGSRLLLGIAAVSVAALAIDPQPAHAQFVCGGSTDGSGVQTGATADATGSVDNVACGTGAKAISGGADADDAKNTAFGDNANASGDTTGRIQLIPVRNTAIGADAKANGNSSQNTATGFNADASSGGAGFSRNTAIGADSNASGNNSHNISIGNSDASGSTNSNNIASGQLADSHGTTSSNVATGGFSDSFGDTSANVATGASADANGNNSNNVAVGGSRFSSSDTDAFGTNSNNVAVGHSAKANGSNANNTAVGAFSSATGLNASAFGTGAKATHANSAAFGQGATTERADQQVFGTGTNTYTFAGVASDASRVAQDAGGGPEYLVTTNAGGDLAAHTFAELGIASAGDVARNSTRIDENTEGVAMAIAMGGTYLPQPGETIRLSGNWGHFESSNSLAFSGAASVGGGTYLTAGVGVGLEENTVGGRGGVSIGWQTLPQYSSIQQTGTA